MNHIYSDIFYENEKRLAAAFLLYEITEATIQFDGSGDSGQIDYINLISNSYTDEQLKDCTVTVFNERPSNIFNPEKNTWETPPPTEQTLNLYQALEEHIYSALESTGIDWYNNDGGFGSWEWTPTEGVKFAVNTRIMEVQDDWDEIRPLGKVSKE